MRVKKVIKNGKELNKAKEIEGCKILIPGLQELDETIATNRELILEKSTKFYENLYKGTVQ